MSKHYKLLVGSLFIIFAFLITSDIVFGAVGTTVQLDYLFKHENAAGFSTTDKAFYEETTAYFSTIGGDKVWLNSSSLSDFDGSVASGLAVEHTAVIMEEDLTVSGGRAWFNTTEFTHGECIPPAYNQSYTAKFYESDDTQIFGSDAANPLFEYATCRLSFENTHSFSEPIKVTAWTYEGDYLGDGSSLGGSGGGNTTEEMQDAVGAMAGAHLTYTDGSNDLSVDDDWYDSVADIDTASPSNGDTTHLSTADQIYDWVAGNPFSWITNAVSDLSNYYLKTEIDTQGEVETIWGVSLATDGELSDGLAAQDACSEITGCVESAITGSSPTITTPTLTLSTSATTTNGNIYYDNANDWIMVYDGSAVDNYVSTGTKTDEYLCSYEATGTKMDCDLATSGSGSAVRVTSATVTTPLLTLSTTANTASGRIYYDATNDQIKVGDGATSDVFMPVTSVTDEYLCSYESAGTTLVCDVNPSTYAAQNLFATIDASSGTDPVADSTTDTLQIIGGTDISVTGDSGADSITIAYTGSGGADGTGGWINTSTTTNTTLDVTITGTLNVTTNITSPVICLNADCSSYINETCRVFANGASWCGLSS